MQPRLLKHPARLAGASLLRLQDDDRLVALAREGHDPAFAAIVDRYSRQLERYCARLLGPGRAEDAVQQAFVNAHAAMRASDQELALKPWLFRIAHNAALNILRAAKDEQDALVEERPGAVQTADVVELRERLRETLASIQALPTAQRDALVLRELEGRSHEEIAAVLGVTEGGARQHLHRARVSLRAAASAITPYPVLARVLNAAAGEAGRGADVVSGAGLGAGAGAFKVAAGVLAAGAFAGGAVGIHHHRAAAARTSADRSATSRSTTASSAANGPSAGTLDIADHQSAGATSGRDRRGLSGARGHGDGRLALGHRGSSGREGEHGTGSGDHRGTSGDGRRTAEHGSSHDGGFTDSGSPSGSSHDQTTTEASHDGSPSTGSGGTSGSTSTSGSGSGDAMSPSSSGSGTDTVTTPTPLDTGGSRSADPATTLDH